MYEKWHFFETVDDFRDFSWINGDKIENSKTIVSTTDTLTSCENSAQKYPAVSEIGCGVWGHPTEKCSIFEKKKQNLDTTYEEKFHQISMKLQS